MIPSKGMGVLPFDIPKLQELLEIYHTEYSSLNESYNNLLSFLVMIAEEHGGAIEVPLDRVEELNKGGKYTVDAVTDDERGVLRFTVREQADE